MRWSDPALVGPTAAAIVVQLSVKPEQSLTIGDGAGMTQPYIGWKLSVKS
ncbi:hypothetical protein I547_1072 [Mycobacterium kansasii 824]|uniref:Uncharacterized protein n=1 Tax=Mycobacterium kansasii TaxID=1768 RepID=A0A1V3XXN3_MYCKA|nr:hypothetical protein I547_1072 [Mycobacterium kansasii 824]OOK67587.1 hypothetical protein BZL30_7508 [Mycobacterium kansasii]OOK83241.1 hypothetical protein BZL29_0341 [Mycobacterium kansasii]